MVGAVDPDPEPDPDPCWARTQLGLWVRIRIRIRKLDPDPGGAGMTYRSEKLVNEIWDGKLGTSLVPWTYFEEA